MICLLTVNIFFVAKVVASRYMQAAQAKGSVSVLMEKVNHLSWKKNSDVFDLLFDFARKNCFGLRDKVKTMIMLHPYLITQ